MTTTPAGWYPDPQVEAQQRYWDGETWTEHVAPGVIASVPSPAPRKRLSTGAIVAIVAGTLVLLGLIASVFVAIAIPVYLNQQHEARESAARADAAALGTEIAAYAVDTGAIPTLVAEGSDDVMNGPAGGEVRVPRSDGVELGGYVFDEVDFCLGTVVTDGSGVETWFYYSSWEGLQEYPCWE